MKVGRRLATKLLNVTKFVLGIVGDARRRRRRVTDPVDLAMLARLDAAIAEATTAFDGLRLRPGARAHRGVLLVVLRRLRRAGQGPGLRRPRRRRRRRRRAPRCARRSTRCSGCSPRRCRSPPRRRGAGRTTAASTPRRGRRPPARRRPGRSTSTPSARCSARVRRAKTEAKLSQRAPVARARRAGAGRGARRRSRPRAADLVDALTVTELELVDGDELTTSSSSDRRRRRSADRPSSRFARHSWPRGTPPRPRRTWPERLAIAGTIVAAVVCFVAAGGLAAGYMVVRDRDVVEITNPAERRSRRRRRRRRPTAPGADGDSRRRRADAGDRRPSTTTAGDVPAGRSDGQELPHHRRRQRRVRRPELAVRAGVRRRRVGPRRRAQRHDHGLPRRPGRRAGRRAVVPPRPLRDDRRHRQPGADQLGVPAATSRSG